MGRDKAVVLAAQKKAKTNEPAFDDIFPVGHARHHHPAAQAPRRHGQGAGRGQAAGAARRAGLPGEVLRGPGRGARRGGRAERGARGAPARGADHLRGLRQAQQAHPARDARQRRHHRRPGAARRHHRGPPLAQAARQAVDPGDRLAARRASRSSSSSCRARSRSCRWSARSAPASRSRWRSRRRSTTSTSRCRRSRRSWAIATSSRTRSRSSRRRSATSGCRRRPRSAARKELKKLKMMSPMSAEATVVRNYIDWILSLPWAEVTEDKLDIAEAEKVLDEDHHGLRKVKERILEYLAVQTLVAKIKGPILCLVGPPGVGKTSLARSPSPAPWGAASCASAWAACATRPRSAATGAPTSARCPARSSSRSSKAGASQPGGAARRGGQDVHRLPRRPVGGAARGARPGAERHLRRPLPRPRLRPLQGDVRLHRQHHVRASRCRCRTAWRSSGWPATPTRRSSPSPTATWCRGSGRRTASPTSPVEVKKERAPAPHPPLHQGGRGPLAGAGDRQPLPQDRPEVIREGQGAGAYVIGARRVQKLLGPPRFRHGTAEAEDQVGAGHRPRLDRAGRRAAHHRGHGHARQGQAHHHRQARRRDAGVGPGRHELRAQPRRGARAREALPRADRHPRARARGRHPQGRPLGRHHHGHRAGLGAHPRAGPQGHRHDRRDHAARADPPGRRPQGEGAGRRTAAASRPSCSPRESEKDLREIPRKVREAMSLRLMDHMDEVLREALAAPERGPSLGRDPAADDAQPQA